jgi:hypothetical protein
VELKELLWNWMSGREKSFLALIQTSVLGRETRMSYPGPGPITRYYRSCLVCGRPFLVRRCQLRETNRAKFCTKACYNQSRLEFSQALKDGRLEAILTRERDALTTRRRSSS